ncbi:MAG: hypothetical protein ACI8RZ_003638 [Myxococcota bacterium]|jgi:hypothetical protein
MYQVVAGKRVSEFQTRRKFVVFHDNEIDRMICQRGQLNSDAYGMQRPQRAF